MEAIFIRKEQKLIKEGLFIIDSFEEYTRKNSPDIYKKYLDLSYKILINVSSKWYRHMRVLEDVKFYINKINLEMYDDMITEMENYINTFKPKVILDRENFRQIYDIVKIINEISKLPDQTRLNYVLKCKPFLLIKISISNNKIFLSD